MLRRKQALPLFSRSASAKHAKPGTAKIGPEIISWRYFLKQICASFVTCCQPFFKLKSGRSNYGWDRSDLVDLKHRTLPRTVHQVPR